jgi:hypothetical protein
LLGQDQRLSIRVPFQVPVRVLGPLKPLEGHLGDLSRTGARVRLPLASLQLERPCTLTELGTRVQAAIEAECEVQLHHVALGSLLTKASHVVRLALPLDGSEAFDLGCLFRVPLTNEETAMLGVALPSLGGEGDWLPRADATGPMTRTPATVREASHRSLDLVVPNLAPAADDPVAPPLAAPSGTTKGLTGKQLLRWRGLVQPSDANRAPVLACALDEVSRTHVRLRVLRNPGSEGAAIVGDDPAAVGVAFGKRYGDLVSLKITDGPNHLWTGPAQVRAVEVPQGTMRDLLLTLAFDRNLTVPELKRLGLA